MELEDRARMRPVLFTAFGYDAASAPAFAGVAALAAYLWFEKRKDDIGWPEADFWGLLGALAVGVFAGSVALYVLIARGALEHLNLAVWKGRFEIPGGTFLGALPGAAIAAALYARLRRRPFGPAADVLAAAAPLGLIFMRTGCALNGCCFGTPTGGRWGFVFDGPHMPAALRGTPLHPTQLYEALGALAIFLFVDRVVRPRIKAGLLRPGDGLWACAGLYGALRFFLEFVRAQDPTLLAPHLVQWAGAATAAAAAVHFRRTRA